METQEHNVKIYDRGYDFEIEAPSLPVDLYYRLRNVLEDYASERRQQQTTQMK